MITLSLGLTWTVKAQTADETAVKSLGVSFATAFADDADFTNWVGQSAHGRADIVESAVDNWSLISKNTHCEYTGNLLAKVDVCFYFSNTEFIYG